MFKNFVENSKRPDKAAELKRLKEDVSHLKQSYIAHAFAVEMLKFKSRGDFVGGDGGS